VATRGQRERLFTRRLALLGGAKVVLLTALVGRMYQLQVVEAEHYSLLSDRNRIKVRPLPPARGRLLDAQGRVLAQERPYYEARMSDNADADLLRQRIARLTGAAIEAEGVVLAADLGWDTLARLQVNLPDLPGLEITTAARRSYELGSAAAHVVGTLGPSGPDNVARRAGRTGAEALAETRLRGEQGLQRLEVTASGRPVREIDRRPATNGQDVRLTLDAVVQETLHHGLARHRSAAGVILHAHTGAIAAMASAPSFDPALFAGDMPAEAWNRLTKHPDRPLLNKAIGGAYAPGSTFKPVVALAALAEGATDGRETVFCPGYLKLGDATFHCWKRGGHGHVDQVAALEQSCDVYFYEMALRLGVDPIERMARRFGFGQVSGLGLPGEGEGFVPSQDWKLGRFGEPWQQGETAILGIGQGYLTATPLQLAMMTATLVNGGHPVTPRLLQDRERAVPPAALPLRGDWLHRVRAGLDAVVNGRRGTARRAALPPDLGQMGGKTGTAQVRSISAAERRSGVIGNDDLPWRIRDHALFIGYAPVDAPNWVAAVVVEHGGSGSVVAAPIVRDALAAALRTGGAA
jgi:penicillin-binding protein 2